MNLVLLVLILLCAVTVLAKYNLPVEPTDSCAVEAEWGRCLPLPACAQLIALLQDPRTTKEALKISQSRKCGFEGVNLKVCCLRNETQVDTESRVGEKNSTSSPEIVTTEDPTGDYEEIFNNSRVCGRGHLPIYEGPCFRHKRQMTYAPPAIAGGELLSLGRAPWMALLGYTSSSNFWECGGSIITRRHILTAAHCINHRLFVYLVRIGELDLAREDDGATPTDFVIKRHIPHEEYNTRTHVNDIGLLLLEETIQFTNLIKPICLPNLENPTDWPTAGDSAIVAGWGRVAHNREQSSHVLYAQLDVFETSFCKHQYRNYSNAVIDDRILCVGDIEGVKDSCKGDSGGPLIVKMCDTHYSWHYTQVGVVSYGLECARAGYPGVYTRVAHYMPWIREKIRNTL